MKPVQRKKLLDIGNDQRKAIKFGFGLGWDLVRHNGGTRRGKLSGTIIRGDIAPSECTLVATDQLLDPI